ncbi:two component transcriptional regulator, AraC family [Paenibacillus curdlanolyticus YK9]|uniref:Two component transcriptional regulator, AraC family n=1 Tax=Paenibacillus curdlanolyticus YK9 TaxID=717606 RepID=E0IFF4_9BACL|nr:helix-turn-helix domain-containing protein [Paenibacillus curdlanolyticus]EFM08930.1 two component transcriptional regulator, AraC family [Paenibacillus curdlanolyticus YK9]
MTQMLVVDDERFAVEGICQCADWRALGIESVHTANHADEARKILMEYRIDILICDIEMPDEDGLSLVRWTKENSPCTESLFLTCHSEFTYAKQAINLGSFDYLLKPVDGEELAQAVKRMLQAIKEKEESIQHNEMYLKYKELWKKQQPLLAERFWQDLLSRRIFAFGDFLERAIQDAQLDLGATDKVMPILISIEEWQKPLDARDQEIMEYALKKAAEEVFLSGSHYAGDVITDRSGVLLVLVRENGFSGDDWTQACTRFIDVCRTYFYCQVTCYVGRLAQLQEVSRLCEALKSMERNNVNQKESVIFYKPQAVTVGSLPVPNHIDVSLWSAYMLNGERDKLIELIHQSIEQLEATPTLTQQQLDTYYHDTLQVVYNYLHVKGIKADDVPQFSILTAIPIRNLSQYKHWSENLIWAVMDTVLANRESDGVVKKVIQFIKEQVEENISRDDVANHVNLNPAYLSRLFKKETGANLIDYLIETKMKRAKQLLESTSLTVSGVALQVGYSNFSHFTKMFKKQFGMNPQEYRNAMSQND